MGLDKTKNNSTSVWETFDRNWCPHPIPRWIWWQEIQKIENMRCLGNNLSRYISKHQCFSVTYHVPLEWHEGTFLVTGTMDFWKDNRRADLVLTGKREDRRHCVRLTPFSTSMESFQVFPQFYYLQRWETKVELTPLSSFSYWILKEEDTRWQVFYEWDLCLSGLITLTYISKENPATSFHGHFYYRSLGLLQRVADGALGWVEDFNKSEAWKLLRTVVRTPTKDGRSRRGERGAQTPLLLPLFFTKCHWNSYHQITHQTPLNWPWSEAVSRA